MSDNTQLPEIAEVKCIITYGNVILLLRGVNKKGENFAVEVDSDRFPSLATLCAAIEDFTSHKFVQIASTPYGKILFRDDTTVAKKRLANLPIDP